MFKELVELVKKKRALAHSLVLAFSYVVLANIISAIFSYSIIIIYLIFIVGLLCEILVAVRRWGR